MAIETADHLRAGWIEPTSDEDRLSHGQPTVDELQRALDRAHIRLLTALDAVAGAEAEGGAAGARVRELELKQHMLEVERDQLLREVERLSRSRGSLRRAVRSARSLARRMLS